MEDEVMMATLAEATPAPGSESLPPELKGEDEPVLQKIKRIDAQREGFPGEHWMVLGLGIALWHFTRHNRHWAVRTAGSFGAAALVARAASGREGLAKVLRWTPLGRGIARNCPPSVKAETQRRP